MTLQEFNKLRVQYNKTAFVGRSPGTMERSRQSLDNYEEFMFYGGHGENPDFEDLDLYSEWLKDVHKRHKRQGVQLVSSHIVRFLRWCVRAGHITKDPSTVIFGMKITQAQTKPAYTRSDYEAMRDAAVGTDLSWLVICGWATGMATVDICLLRLDEVDLDNWCIIKQRSKSGSSCVIPIETGSEFHAALLEKIKSVDLNHPVHDKANQHYYLCPTLAHRYKTKQGEMAHDLRKLQKRAGVDKRKTFHSMRVAFCSMLANGNINLGLACKMTGHRNPGTFVRRYMKVKPAVLHQVLTEARNKQVENESGVFM